MEFSKPKTPGVYINEQDAFPNTVVPVATAVPAFIGYTPQAAYEGQSYTNVAKKISSFAEFKAIYCYPDPNSPADSVKQYKPQYYLVAQKVQPDKGDYVQIDGTYYSIVPDPYTIYYLYNSIKLFYENGGAEAYIVSVGTYGAPSGQAMTAGNQIINPNVKLNELLNGLALLKNETEPTLYICPEATLLSVNNNGSLMQAMLLQNSDMKTVVSIFDVIKGNAPNPILWTQDIESFRQHTGTIGLDYGVAYYPFIGTTIMQQTDMDYTNLFGGNLSQLEPLLNPSDHPNPTVATIIENIKHPQGTSLTVAQNNNALIVASATYKNIIDRVLAQANILPPSGAIAGVYTRVDMNDGVWIAPANTSIVGAVSLPIDISESEQSDLNFDAVSGKSVNAIRYFNGRGILIWGARTLDGNSMDWQYINVRRTIMMIAQSCKLATEAFVFEPNDQNTWESVKAMLSSFLTGLWNQGALMGSTPSNAFSVACGLGTTMTNQDLLTGVMKVHIAVAIMRPAEFIVITFEQTMAQSS